MTRPLCTVLALALVACTGGRPATELAPPGPGYEQEMAAYWAERLEALTGPEGWMGLLGLYWLEPGENRFGTGEENELVLPDVPTLAGLPATLGAFRLHDGMVTVAVVEGVPMTRGGGPVGSAALAADGAAEDRLELGSLRMQVIERSGHLGIRVRDLAHDGRERLAALDPFPVDPGFRLAGHFERYDPPRALRLPTVLPWEAEQLSAGAIRIRVEGEEYRLDVASDDPSAPLFLIVGDTTNGKETYGGGRYLYVAPPAPGEDRLVVDFNRAYSPPCVFTPYATCPLPPPQNRLPFAVTAGERVPASKLY